ncbi:5'-deoxynucleotidase [[Clostridium] fimetarium]|uniref:5'-deoxynucleotidase n=1 Tax=[Clostridium] fimetarium TaxID=99656 RepID=A0A1I0MTP0_9FIRM|nr:5'-deoxynucleotidase [[Clostridium] fimetarium]SEV92089.1 5'-deoxynucleotidase [[Clostridium] fimetarium]
MADGNIYMKNNHFYAMLSRMKFINRWGLMRNTKNENICEHSLEVAFIAHALGIINNQEFNGNINAERLAILGMYHDVTEIVTGDMPTPVKYYNPIIRNAYKEVENVAKDALLSGLPEKMRKEYDSVLMESAAEEDLWKYVKAADKISALVKCIEEKRMGNTDFEKAEISILKVIENMDMPEVKYFMENFIPAYKLTLDESN